MGRIARILTTAGALMAVVASCAAGPPRPGGTPQVEPSWASCAAAAPTTDPAARFAAEPDAMPRLGDDFAPVAAVVCAHAPARRSDGGEDLVATERRATDVVALVATLRLPDEPRTDQPCTQELRTVPWFAVLDAQGRWVRPGAPADTCGKIRIEVLDAVQRLSLTTVSSQPVQQVESAEAAAAGCSQQWADMIRVTTGAGTPTPTSAPVGALPAGTAPVRLCVYQVPAEQQRTGKPAGDFRSGGRLPGERWAAVRRLVPAAPPVVDCRTPAGRFAVLLSGSDAVYVELDGCHRVAAPTTDGGQTLRQATPALRALLATPLPR